MKISFEGTKKENPAYDGGMKVPYATAKRLTSSWRWYLVVFITASPLIIFLIKITVSYLFNSAPGMISIKMTDLNAPESAYISKIHVNRGDEIIKGDVIADLYDPATEDHISFLTAEMEILKPEKKVVPPNSRLEANLKLAQKILSQQARNLEQIKYLFSKGAATAAELNLAQSQYNQAELEVSRSTTDLEVSESIIVDKESRTRVERLKKEIETNRAKTERFKVSSPFNGIISDIYVTENQSISKGTKIARISIPEEYSIKAYLDPSKLSRAKKGKRVTIRLPGPTLIKGYVASDLKDAQKMPSEISESFYESRQTIEVIIIADQPVPQKFRIDGLPIKIFFGFLFF